jgi:glycosyltransferase involved in cell wall biosynthesis
MAKVTVVLPVFNGANFLRESIDSVLQQDLSDFELHVLDDGSSDDTATIARSTGDPRVRYSRNPGRCGLYRTLNRGFDEAKTELVRIWAHDDRMVRGSLRAFVDFASCNPGVGMVFSQFVTIDTAGNRSGCESVFAEAWRRIPPTFRGDLAALLFWVYGCLPGNVSTVLMTRQAWERTGRFLEGIQQAPDYDMWVRVSELFQIGFLNQGWVELRDHPLQLGKVGGKLMTTIEEELPVVRNLERRLSNLVSQSVLRRGWRERRGREHVQWVARALLRRDFQSARRGLRAVASFGQPGRQIATWLFSANGRIWNQDRDVLFDSLAPRGDDPDSIGSLRL